MSGAFCVLSRIRIAKDMVFSRLHKWWLLTLLVGLTTVVSAQNGVITTVAGSGDRPNPNPMDINVPGAFSGDGGPATSARFAGPGNIALDASGNLYIADNENHRIRKVDNAGIITTVAGSGAFFSDPGGFSGDGGPATSALLNLPIGVAVDAAGNIYIADSGNHRIRKVDTGGTITTVVGTGGFCIPFTAACGDGGPATSATLIIPRQVAVDTSGNLFISDLTGRIRKVDGGGTITTVAAMEQYVLPPRLLVATAAQPPPHNWEYPVYPLRAWRRMPPAIFSSLITEPIASARWMAAVPSPPWQARGHRAFPVMAARPPPHY